jgi:hypothetical protein
MFIYRLFNLDTPDNTVYIGQTRKSLKKRLTTHKYDARHKKKNTPISNWIFENNSKVGIELVEEVFVNPAELDNREIYWIAEYSKSFKLLNVLKGGRNAKNGALFGVANGKARRILQYDLNGVFIKQWDSIIDASNSLNCSYTKISDCVKLSAKHNSSRSSLGFIWKYWSKDFPQNVENIIKRNINNNKKCQKLFGHKIYQYDLTSNILIKKCNTMN